MSQGWQHPVSTTPLPGHGVPQAGRRRGSSFMVLEKKNGRQGQRPRKPYKQQHARRMHPRPTPATRIRACSRAHTHTHTRTHSLTLVASPSKLSAGPRLSVASRGHALLGRPIGSGSDCVEEKSLSQMPQGFHLYTLSPGLASRVRGTEAGSTTPSSTFSPPPPESNQMTRSPLLTASDKPTWAGTTCPNMHSSTTTHRFP